MKSNQQSALDDHKLACKAGNMSGMDSDVGAEQNKILF